EPLCVARPTKGGGGRRAPCAEPAWGVPTLPQHRHVITIRGATIVSARHAAVVFCRRPLRHSPPPAMTTNGGSLVGPGALPVGVDYEASARAVAGAIAQRV